MALLFLTPTVVAGQPAIDPEAMTVQAIEELRSAQLFFPEAGLEIEEVVQRLERSLVDAHGQPLVVDSCHVRAVPDGLRPFIEARQAVIGLGEVLETPMPPFTAKTLARARGSVVEAYRFLAEVAVQEARALARAASSGVHLGKAEMAFADALEDLARDRFARAMQSFRQAWQHARMAIPEATGDGKAPSLNIEFPIDGADLFTSPVNVSGMVQLLTTGTVGPEDVDVRVNGTLAEVAHRSFQAAGIDLREGLNAIVAVAEDADGESATACIAVRLDTAPRPLVTAVSGDGQTAPIATPLPEPLVVRVADETGGPVGGAQVIFRVVQGNGRLGGGDRAEVAKTDAAGRAQTSFVLGTRAGVGVNRVRATAVGFDGEVVFSAVATPTAPESLHVAAGDNQNGGVGEVLPLPLTVLVLDAGQNPAEGVDVTFEVLDGGGTMDGAGIATAATDANGRASVELTLGPEAGLDNNVVEARFGGLANEPATFKASAFVLGDPAETSVSGVVLDNQGDPVPGVTMRIVGTELVATTDALGVFAILGAPVGHALLEVDASTTTRPGTWAHLEFDLELLPGVDNRLPKPIYILPLDLASGRVAGGGEDVTVTVPQVPGFELTVAAGSATFPDGSPTGLVSVTAVHADRIPMAPGSGMQPRFIVSIQPAGTRFDPPAPVSFPNADSLAPGTVTEMFSFDHDLGAFVSIGTGTVSEDGLTVRSDPGFGIVKAGWHCAAGASGNGAGGPLSIFAPERVVLCAGQPRDISAQGELERDVAWSWTIDDPTVATLDPSSCADTKLCETTITPRSLGATTATVSLMCTTNGKSREEEVRVFVNGVDFVENEENADQVDLLRLFNPSPVVVMDKATLSSPDAAVEGTVKDFIAPVHTVLVNGAEVTVTQTSAGPDSRGPFEGTFSHTVTVGEAEAQVVATALNALGNAGADTLLIRATRDASGSINQTVAPLAGVPSDGRDVDPADFDFRIEVFDESIEDDTVTVLLEGHAPRIELRREGSSPRFRSAPLFIVPTTLEVGQLSEDLEMTRIPKALGMSPEVEYEGCIDEGVVTGALFIAPEDAPSPLRAGGIQHFALVQDISTDPVTPLGVVGLVGMPSEQGGQTVATITASVRSLGPDLSPVTGAPFTVPAGRAIPPPELDTVTLEMVAENLYRTKPDESFLPVGGLLPRGVDPDFLEIFVDPAGFLELEAGGDKHVVPLAGPAFRDAVDPAKGRRLASRFPPAPVVVIQTLQAADKDLTNARVNRMEGLVVSFVGPKAAPALPVLTDSLGRTITPTRDPANLLDSPDDGVFVFRFTTGDVDLSDRSFVRLTVTATSAGAFMGSDSVDLRTMRDAGGAVTDITSAEGPVRPSWYGPVASGPDAERGVVLPEKLGEVLAPYQFVLVANALVADTRLLGATPAWIQAGLVEAGGALADVKLFDFTRTEKAPGELANVTAGMIRTKRLLAVRDGLTGVTDVQLPADVGRVTAAMGPLTRASFAEPPPPSEAFVFEVELSTDADNDGDIDPDDEVTEHGRAIREGLVSRTVALNDDDDDAAGGPDNSNATLDGSADKGDMAKVVLRQLLPDVDVGEVVLKVSDKSVLRVFDPTDTAVLGPAPGPDRDVSDDLRLPLQGASDLEFRVEGVRVGEASLSLVYLSDGGAELFRDEVTITVAARPSRLAGIELGGFPHFDFVGTFNKGTAVQATFDGFLRPDKVGKTADVYVVDHMDPVDWLKPPASAPGLADVSGGAEALTVQPVSASESSLEKNIVDAWSVADTPGRYDVVFDFGSDLDDPDTPDGKFDPSVDLIDSLTGTSAGFFVVEDPGTIVATEGGVPITETGFAEYIMETRKEVFVNGTFKSHVTLRGRIRYPASTTLVATRPVILGIGNGTVSTPSPVGGASPEFFEAAYSKPSSTWYLLGERSVLVKKVPAAMAGTSATWTLDVPGKFTGAVITEGTTPFVSGDRVYFTITRKPLAGTRPVVFIVHGNHIARLTTEPSFFEASSPLLPNPMRDTNLVILETSDTPLRARYVAAFDAPADQWRIFQILPGSPPPSPTPQGVVDFDTEITTTDTNVTFLIKRFPATAGSLFLFDTSPDVNTPDKSYRGYQYLTDHLSRNGLATISVSLDDFALIESDAPDIGPGAGIGARFEVFEETIKLLKADVGVPNILTGLLDFSDLSAIGHSRGGEVVPIALKASGLDINRGVSIAPTRTTAVTDPTGGKDFLVIYGAYDCDVKTGNPFGLYDRSEGLKLLVFADRANHNFFNRSWGEQDLCAPPSPGPPPIRLNSVDRTKHEDLATAYTMAFLLDSFDGRREYLEFFLRDTSHLQPPLVTVPSESLSIQSLAPKADNLVIDDYDGVAATNSLGQTVDGSNLDLIDDIALTVPSPPALPIRNYYHDTKAGVLEFDVTPSTKPIYRSQTAAGGVSGLDVTTFSYVTLRVAQEHGNAKNPRVDLDFSLMLTDALGQRSVVDVGSFGFTIPPSYLRLDATGTAVMGEPNKSHFKTVRIPLWAFTADGRYLDLNKITDVRLVLDKPRSGKNQGALGVDDLAFEK